MNRTRVRDPIIPASTTDRTGTAGILRRALAAIRRRFDGLQREVLGIFGSIRIVGELAQNDMADRPRTIYALTPEELAAVSYALQQALDRWLLEGKEARHLFWWAPFVSSASHAGAAQSVTNLSRLSPAYAAARSLQEVLFSEPYRNRVAMAQIKSYEHWTGLSAGEKSALSQIIGRGVVDGKSPRIVAKEIAERLGVSRARAEGYAQSDVTDTLRRARWDEQDWAIENLGMNLGLLHVSALIPTTRATHAARHGIVYSTANTRDFYSRDGNIYRCHCSQVECLIGEDGKPLLSDNLRARFGKEIKAWKRA